MSDTISRRAFSRLSQEARRDPCVRNGHTGDPFQLLYGGGPYPPTWRELEPRTRDTLYRRQWDAETYDRIRECIEDTEHGRGELVWDLIHGKISIDNAVRQVSFIRRTAS